MQQGKSGGRLFRIAAGSLLLLFSVGLPMAAFEAYLAWDNRRPQIALTNVELAGQTYGFMEPAAALADVRDAVLIVGDSFTAGAACGLDGSYPSQVNRLFAQNGDPYRALNLGIPGADPFGYLNLVESLIAEDRIPPLVVVTLYSNDIELTCTVCRVLDRIRQSPQFSLSEIERLESLCKRCAKADDVSTAHYSLPRRVHNELLSISYTYSLFRDALVGLSMQLGYNTGWGRTAYPPLWRDHGSTEFKMLRFALAEVRNALSARGSETIVVIYPDMEDLRRNNEYVGLYGAAEMDLSRSLGIPVWSGYPAFLNSRNAKRNMFYSLVDHHPSCEAHRIFAEGVYTRLREAGWTTDAPRRVPHIVSQK